MPLDRGPLRFPTQAQLAFALKLGIEIPEGISRERLSFLIDQELRRPVAEYLRRLEVGTRIRARAGRKTFVVRTIHRKNGRNTLAILTLDGVGHRQVLNINVELVSRGYVILDD